MRKVLLLLTFLVLTFRINAQEIEWQNTIGGSGSDQLQSIIKTTDGGYLLGGYTGSGISGDKSEMSMGGYDYWIVKTDSIGIVQWDNTIGGNDDEHLNSIIQTFDGGYLLGGFSHSLISGDKTENPIGWDDYWIVKTDSLGLIQWDNTIGGLEYEYLNCIIQANDGGYLIGGASLSDISGDKTDASNGDFDFWIVKIDSLGNIQWQNSIGGLFGEELREIISTNDNGFLLSGTSRISSTGDQTALTNGGSDYWVVKIDSLGNVLWDKSYGGADTETLRTAIQTNDGGYLFGGDSNSNISGDKTENSMGSYDYWVIKTDSLGNILWENTIGANNLDILFSVIQTSDDGYLLGGVSTSEMNGDKTEGLYGYSNYWVVKIDGQGNIEWQNTLLTDSGDELNNVLEVPGGYLLAGNSQSSYFGDKTENSHGILDYWIVKITGNYNLIKGKTYADLNSNQQHEFGESPILYHKVTENETGRFGFSQNQGVYYISLPMTGNFEVTPDFQNYYNSVPMVHTSNFSAMHQIDSMNNFAFQPVGNINDLCITITPTTSFRSGFNASYSINYSNQGTTTLIPIIVFYPDTNVNFVSASITPTTITPDSVIFVLATLAPFQSGQITITVSVDLGLPIGTLVNSGAMILPIANDANPGCNSSYWEVLTTGSFDPNDILVNRSFLYDYEMASPPDLEYIIRFQNTGNDTAFTVKILNPIDTTRLDLSTLDIVTTSHDADVRFVYHERNLEFVMNNILLPDSNTNEPMSHGFVRYSIKPKTTVAVGDSIQNFAAIYFDFNSPVITNTAVTHIILPTGLTTTHQNSPPAIFPNPTTDKITIRVTETAKKIETITLYNLYGQQVKNIVISPAFSTEISIEDLVSGIYFLKVNNENSFVSKIVKY